MGHPGSRIDATFFQTLIPKLCSLIQGPETKRASEVSE